MKFVWLDVPNGGRVPINPDQVQYLRAGRGGETMLVFGALTGGYHQLEVLGAAEDVVKALEGEPRPPPQPDRASPRPRAGSARARAAGPPGGPAAG